VASPKRFSVSNLSQSTIRRTAVTALGAALMLGMATPAFADAGTPAPLPASTLPVSALADSALPAAAHHAAVAAKAATVAAPKMSQLMHGKPRHQVSTHLNATQKANAAAIVKASKEMKLPPRAAVIAVATALQESTLHNYKNLGRNNDHDSVGLFQQRPSAGWGSPKQCETPDHAAKSFMSRLVKVHNWNKIPLTRAAQAVQVSAYGDRYAKWENQAAHLVASNYAR
jgi:hypothetical protein